MAVFTPEALQALAEALAAPAKELAAGLLRRPLPDPEAEPTSAESLALDLAELHAEALPDLREAMGALNGIAADDVEDAVEELADPIFALMEAARDLHRAALAPEAEALRPFLAAIAEDPVTDTLEIFLYIIQTGLNPWGLCDDPEHPELHFDLKPDAHAHLTALRVFCAKRPGLLSADALDRLAEAISK